MASQSQDSTDADLGDSDTELAPDGRRVGTGLAPGHPAPGRATIARLTPQEEPAARQLLGQIPGEGLFIASMLLTYGIDHPILRLWGQYRGDAAIPEAILMITNTGACIAAENGHTTDHALAESRSALRTDQGVAELDVSPLRQVVARENPPFVMGRADLVDLVTRGLSPTHIEEHAFADLPRHRRRVMPPPPAGITVRRAERGDVDALATLYLHSEGFEGWTYDRVRRVMAPRVTQYRTYVATDTHSILAAASTSAETLDAAMIGGVWTAPESRGRGLATGVVGALAAALWREGRHPYLFFRHGNLPATRLYATLGFRVTTDWRIVHFDHPSF